MPEIDIDGALRSDNSIFHIRSLPFSEIIQRFQKKKIRDLIDPLLAKNKLFIRFYNIDAFKTLISRTSCLPWQLLRANLLCQFCFGSF